MALISCYECKANISDQASACPHCGAPVRPPAVSGVAPTAGLGSAAVAAPPVAPSKPTPVLGIVALGLGLAAAMMPYFVAVPLVPAALICGIIALVKGQKKTGIAAIILGLLGLAGIVSTSMKLNELSEGLKTGSLPQLSTPSSAPTKAARVSKSAYDRLADGMSYDEARAIIGVAGEELSRTDIAGYKTVAYMWANDDGSNMNAMFQNGKLMSKAQMGLR